MDGEQLMNFLSLDPYTSVDFQGIVMRDFPSLPILPGTNALYILNTDVFAGEGEHWCVGYFEGDHCEFFDPLGQPPEKYGLDRVLNTRGAVKRYYNSVRVQHLASETCGAHCLFFSFHRCRGYSVVDILKLYGSGGDQLKSDSVAEEFVLKFGKSYALNSK